MTKHVWAKTTLLGKNYHGVIIEAFSCPQPGADFFCLWSNENGPRRQPAKPVLMLRGMFSCRKNEVV